MFKSKVGSKGDHQDLLKYHTFKQWFLEQLLPNIPARSLIILDSAPHHSNQQNKAPTWTSRKGEIIKGLNETKFPTTARISKLNFCSSFGLTRKPTCAIKLTNLPLLLATKYSDFHLTAVSLTQ